MRFGFIAKHRGIWPVALLCSALDVSRSGFHAWLNRSPSARSRHDEILVSEIDRSFKSSDRTYGARRVWHDVLAEGLSCGLRRVERLMRENGLRAKPGRRGLPKDIGERAAVSDNLLDRAFEASAPTQKWIADFTYIWAAEGWLYVAAVVDLFSRRVVGWAMKAEFDGPDRDRRPRFSPEVRARAVRLVLDYEGEHASRWAAVSSIAAKIGCTA